MTQETKRKIGNIFLYLGFALYILLMVEILFLRGNTWTDILQESFRGSRSLNLIPFHTIKGYFANMLGVMKTTAILNIAGNVILFIPLGIYLQVFQKEKQISKTFFWILFSTLSAETLQYAFKLGAADIDDVILNCVGGLIGILLYRVLRRLCKDEQKTRTVVTILSTLVGLPVFSLYLVLKIVNA